MTDFRPLHVTLTELRYIVNLDRERHFGRAAERSFISQPTLSVALKKIEDQLGVELFERYRGEVRPTMVGARLAEQARVVLTEAARFEDLARAGRDELAGELRLGAIPTIGPSLFPKLVPAMAKAYPAMPLVIEEQVTHVLLAAVRAGELDAAVIALPVELVGLQMRPLYDEDFIALVPPGHRLAGGTPQPVSRFGAPHERMLLLGPGHCFRTQVIEVCPACIEESVEGSPAVMGSSLETIRYMVASGAGVTLAPRGSVDNRPGAEADSVVVVELTEPRPFRRVALVWRDTFPRPKALAALASVVAAAGIRGVRPLAGEAEDAPSGPTQAPGIAA